ncbi:hypothetical protein HDE_04093 [Halotydeus destructor]|nr:hypothetical protein HDE_04093 [Halotydeus destructor]
MKLLSVAFSLCFCSVISQEIGDVFIVKPGKKHDTVIMGDGGGGGIIGSGDSAVFADGSGGGIVSTGKKKKKVIFKEGQDKPCCPKKIIKHHVIPVEVMKPMYHDETEIHEPSGWRRREDKRAENLNAAGSGRNSRATESSKKSKDSEWINMDDGESWFAQETKNLGQNWDEGIWGESD